MLRRGGNLLTLVVLLAASAGCATEDAGRSMGTNPRDPWEA